MCVCDGVVDFVCTGVDVDDVGGCGVSMFVVGIAGGMLWLGMLLVLVLLAVLLAMLVLVWFVLLFVVYCLVCGVCCYC